MTADHRIAVAYTLYHPPADPDTIRPLIEKLRQKAIDLGFLRVGDLVCLDGDGEIYFVASLSDSDPVEIGFTYYPCKVEIEGQTVPFGCPYWMWTGTVRTRDLKTFSKLLHFAAEVGIEAAMSFAGMTMIYSKDDAGRVKVDQEWDDILDDC